MTPPSRKTKRDARPWLLAPFGAALVLLLIQMGSARRFGDMGGLAASDPVIRSAFYSALASASAALLGFAITALSILLALPSRRAIDELRQYPAWVLLHNLLLITTLLMGVTLLMALVGIVYDAGAESRAVVSVPTVALAGAAITALVEAGLFLALTIRYVLGAGLGATDRNDSDVSP